MVKTKVVSKKNAATIASRAKDAKRGNKKIIERNLFDAKALKKGQYRDKDNPFYISGEEEPGKKELPEGMNNGWLQSMDDGETCRTFDSNKVHVIISESINKGTGVLIEGKPAGKYYEWFMTRIITDKDTKKKETATQYPKQKGKRK